jgi:hypothetical protein
MFECPVPGTLEEGSNGRSRPDAPRLSDGAAAPQFVVIGTSISHTAASSSPLECDAGPTLPKPGPKRWGSVYSRYERGSMRFHGRLSRSTTAGMSGASQRWVVGAACGIGFLLVTASKAVQAIDCQKASTNVERAICRDIGVYALDRELTQTLHQVLESHPNERNSMLIDERHWRRNRSCED